MRSVDHIDPNSLSIHPQLPVHGKDVQVESDFSKPSTPVPVTPSANQSSSSPKPAAVPGTVNTTTLEETVEMQASAHDIYDVLLNQAKVVIWTRSNKSTIEPKVGSKFSLFGGSVSGEIKELIEDKKIVQSWRLTSWPAGKFISYLRRYLRCFKMLRN